MITLAGRLLAVPNLSSPAVGQLGRSSAARLKGANRPFPSSKKSHFQSEAKCEAIDMKMIFNYYANISHFHNKGFALSLVLKVRFFGTRKWPILWSRRELGIRWDSPQFPRSILSHSVFAPSFPSFVAARSPQAPFFSKFTL